MSSATQQARFFTNLQRLLVEGEFVSSYKYALLIALTRWAVENPNYADGEPLDVQQLAPHFLALYWPQVRPFGELPMRSGLVAEPRVSFQRQSDGAWPSVLRQERGGQRPRVLSLILAEQERGSSRLSDVPPERMAALLREVRGSIRDMPLWRLQKVSGATEFRFLYHRGNTGSEIVFESGIVACLSEFAMLVEQVVRAAWLRFVLRSNQQLLGVSSAGLEDFMFPTGRGNLDVWRPLLVELQGTECFYCRCAMGESHVDHFLPWSRYSRDLGHNFVLACASCNTAKSNHLASAVHLENWGLRNEQHGQRMVSCFEGANMPHDLPVLRRVAGSLYSAAEKAGASAWLRGREFEELGDGWRRVFRAG